MKKCVLALLLSVLLVCGFALPVCAETVVKDGIEVTLTTDKESYDSLDVIDARLTVRNTNGFDVENVSAQIAAPEGYALSGDGEVKIGELSAGEVQVQQASVRDVEAGAPNLPQTGDDSNGMLWSLLLFVSAAVLCGLVIRNPQAKRTISLFLCVAMVGTMVLDAVPVVAEKVNKEITVSKQVDVDGKPVTITGIVDYRIESELAEEEESKVIEKTQKTYEHTSDGSNSSQTGRRKVSPMLFARSALEELRQIVFASVSYVGAPGNTYTFSWEEGHSDTYIVNVKILDGDPAYAEYEAGTSIVLNKIQSENSIQFVVPEDIKNGTYIKVHVYGETEGQQTESGNQIYMQIGGGCEHPWANRISGYDTVYIPVDEEEHQIAGHSYLYCGNCGTMIREEITPGSGNQEHVFSNNTNMCTRCGYKRELACDHDFISIPGQRFSLVSPLLDENPTYHQISVGYTLACSKCGEETSSYVSGMAEHAFNSENKCICGYTLDVTCDHHAPVREQVGDTAYEQYSPQIGDYSQFFHMAINKYRTKCSVCGIASEEVVEEVENERHEYDGSGICIYCGDEGGMAGVGIAPELSDIVSSAGDTVNSGEKSTFSATIRDDRVLNYIGVYFDGILQEEYINPPILAGGSFELDWTCLFSKRTGDHHVITFKACDSDGNWAEKEYTVTVTCDHSNEDIQEWAGNTEQIEGNNKIHHVLNTTVTKCLECGYEIDREVTKETEAHKFVDRHCTLCGYIISECLHEECSDVYNPDIPIQYKDNGDGKTHTWQNGYDCICLICGRVTQVYGEEQVDNHDYSTGDVCPCGYDVTPPRSGILDISREPVGGDASDLNNLVLDFEAGPAVTFTIGANDNVQLAKLELFRDGVLIDQRDCIGNSGELTYTTEELTAGTFVLKLVATDAAGWVSTFTFNVNVLESTCSHETYTDYENGGIKYTEKDETSHYYQLGYDRICNKCQETWQVYSDLSEDMVAPHDYTNGDVCLCGYDRDKCEHEPVALEYVKHIFEPIAGDNVNHRIAGVVYKATCGNCQKAYEVIYKDKDIATGETFPREVEHDEWNDGVCGTCGYECAHPAKNVDGNANYQDIYQNSISITDNGNGMHTHIYNVKRTCLNCKYTWTEKLVDSAEVHNIRELTEKGVYKYNADEHWLEVPVGCSCGYRTGEVVTKDKAAHNPQVTTTYRYDPDGNVHQVWEIKNYDCVCGMYYDPEKILNGPSGHSDYDDNGRCDMCGERCGESGAETYDEYCSMKQEHTSLTESDLREWQNRYENIANIPDERVFDISKIQRAIFLNKSGSVGGAGHSAIMIIDVNGNALFFSYFSDDFTFISGEGIAVGKGVSGIKFLSKMEVEDFFNNKQRGGTIYNLVDNRGEIWSNDGYVQGLIKYVSPGEGVTMYNTMIGYFLDPGKYELFGNQCDTVAFGIFTLCGENEDEYVLAQGLFPNITPNSSYDALKKMGIYTEIKVR